MVLAAHNGLSVTPQRVVDVCSPNSREKEEEDVSKVVHGNKKEEKSVGRRLLKSQQDKREIRIEFGIKEVVV